jgi:hypothetical protein
VFVFLVQQIIGDNTLLVIEDRLSGQQRLSPFSITVHSCPRIGVFRLEVYNFIMLQAPAGMVEYGLQV